MSLYDQLATYFFHRRWFAGKGRNFKVVHVDPFPWLSDADPRMRFEVVTVEFDDGTRDTYQFPMVYLEATDPEMRHALVGEVEDAELGEVAVYDAVYFRQASDLLLTAFHDGVKTDRVAFRVVRGSTLPEKHIPGTVMTAEQSNTSIAYGEEAMLKLYRRISAGGNPDIEVLDALTRHGADHVAPLLGWVDGAWYDPEGTLRRGHLGMLQRFLRTATDGWDIALSSVRDLLLEEDLHPDEVGGDFAGEAERLGEATASVHADLATLFDTATLNDDQQRQLAAAMGARLDAAIDIVPELAEHAAGIRRHYDALATRREPITVQRIHGDLHLGQTLRTSKGWKIIDFEGEPAKSLAERIALDSPIRDVAGMLRSFDYAAGATLRQFDASAENLRYRTKEWSGRNRGAFLEGYEAATGEDLSAQRVLLRAYETDKAVYEAVYEARNRPSWLSIPIQAISRIAAEE